MDWSNISNREVSVIKGRGDYESNEKMHFTESARSQGSPVKRSFFTILVQLYIRLVNLQYARDLAKPDEGECKKPRTDFPCTSIKKASILVLCSSRTHGRNDSEINRQRNTKWMDIKLIV